VFRRVVGLKKAAGQGATMRYSTKQSSFYQSQAIEACQIG